MRAPRLKDMLGFSIGAGVAFAGWWDDAMWQAMLGAMVLGASIPRAVDWCRGIDHSGDAPKMER